MKKIFIGLMFGSIASLMPSVGMANTVVEPSSQSNTVQDKALLNLTLAQAIEIALAENPTIRVADKDVALKQVADKEAWMNLLPSVSGNLSLSHNVKVAAMRLKMPDETGTMQTRTMKMGVDGSTTAQGGVSVNLPVFAPTVYQNMKLSKEDILLAQEKASASRQDLVNQVTKAYYGALLAQDSYEVMKKSYNVAKQNYDLVEQKFNVGKVSEYDKLSAEVQMRTMSSTVTSTEAGMKLAMLRLKVLMGVTSDIEMTISDSLKSYEGKVLLPKEIGTNEVDNNTNIKQIDYREGLLKRTRKVLYTNFMPTIGAQFTGQYQSMSNDNWNLFKYSYSPSMTFAVNVNIPIFTASNFTKLKSNRLQLNQLQDTRTNTYNQLSMQAKSYRENMVSSVAKLESDRTAVEQANKAVTISGKRYEVGRGTILELNQSETALTQSELTYCQTIYDYLTNQADLEYTLGRNY